MTLHWMQSICNESACVLRALDDWLHSAGSGNARDVEAEGQETEWLGWDGWARPTDGR